MNIQEQTCEGFSGTCSFSNVAKELGHITLTIDNNPNLNPDLILDLSNWSNWLIFKGFYDRTWFSPICTSFSIASCSHHWNCVKFSDINYYSPKSKEAELGLILLDNTIHWISINKPKKWYIENPRGLMRKIIDDIFKKYGITNYSRVTISYCQYGDTRMKPTDIWTNDFDWIPRPMCKNGDSCHESAPRGSKTGTQGLKNAKDRRVIPPELFYNIFRGSL